MAAVRPERQGFREDHGIERQIGVKMGKKRAAARRLEAQAFAEPFCVDRDKQQIARPAEMSPGCCLGLLRGREMDVTVGDIGRRADEPALVLGFAPQRGGHDFVDDVHGRGHIAD